MLVGEGGELFGRTEEVAIGAQLDRQIQRRQPLAHPPVAGLQDDDALRPQLAGAPRQLVPQRAGVLRVVEPTVVRPPSGAALRLVEVAHGGEEEGETLLVLRNVGRFLASLDLQDSVALRLEAVEGGGLGVQLIAEDEDKLATRPHSRAFRGPSAAENEGVAKSRARSA